MAPTQTRHARGAIPIARSNKARDGENKKTRSTTPSSCAYIAAAAAILPTPTTPPLYYQEMNSKVAYCAPAVDSMTVALDDLSSRFILNCPAEAAKDEMLLLMFEVEKAFWFYLDFWREHDKTLPYLNMRDFTKKFFQHCVLLRPYADKIDTILSKWQAYKKEVPTYGCVILNDDCSKILLVRGWNSKSWGWPKGKVNKGEDETDCAAREVQEEIGFDVSPLVDEKNVITSKVGDVLMKLYVIPGVCEGTVFQTQTRKEISEIKWHPLSEISKESSLKTYSVAPILGRLRGWIADHKRSLSRSRTPEKKSSPPSPVQKGKDKKGLRRPVEEVDMAGVKRNNCETFAGDLAGFSAEDMFKVNEQKYGYTSTYSIDHYTTRLPCGSDEAVAVCKAQCMYADRYKPCQILDAQAGTTPAVLTLPATGCNKSSLLSFKLDTGAIMSAMVL